VNPLKVGIIGAGGHAQSHFAMISEEVDMNLVAVAELDPVRLKRAHELHGSFEGFSDYTTMLDNCDLDVVYAITMPGYLTDIVVACLERGLHTSIEKPAGMSSADTERMLEASERSNGKAIVSVNRRYMPQVLAAKQMLLGHGGAVQVAATYNKPITTLGTSVTESLAPAPIICDAIHHVDLLRWLSGRNLEEAGDASNVYAQSWSGDREGSFRYNAIMEFDTGCRGVMMSHYGVGFRIQKIEAHAEDLSIYLDLTGKPDCRVYLNGAEIEGEMDLESVGGPHYNETRHFVECIRGDKRPWSSLDDLVKTMKFCEDIATGALGEASH
jgi:predicted dehydrogenase